MSTRRERAQRIPRCPRCGEVRAAHYVPASFGDPGFYICERKDGVKRDYGVSARFEELCAEFTARSEGKHPNGARAVIEHYPAFAGRRDPLMPDQWLFKPHSQSWSIRYCNPDGTTIHWGAVVGHTKAGVIAWLLRQRKAFP